MAGLIGSGQAYKRQALGGLETASHLEQQRNMENKQRRAHAHEAHQQQVGALTIGGAMAGAELGAQTGVIAGPWGAAIGAVAGFIAGELL
jgi:uncharacterized membrane protein